MMRTRLLFGLALLSLAGAAAQTDSGETFKAGVTMIQVPVVVRDHDGHVVNNLTKDDFQLFDNGKQQEIVSFAVENPGSRTAPDRSLPGTAAGAPPPAGGTAIPERFIAYFFDDVSFRDTGDLTHLREAAAQQFGALQPGDRVAIFTTSCHVQVDFTADRQKLLDAISRLQLNPVQLCRVARTEIAQVVLLRALVRRMSNLPARRDIVLVSPGFFVGPDRSRDEADMIDGAVRNKVSIHAIDVGERTGASISRRNSDLDPAAAMMGSANPANPLVLVEIAHGTGGTYVTGNDFGVSFRKLATPESHYVLSFIPNAKADGRQHQLKVKLENSRKLTVEARSGYYAPQRAQ